MANTSVSSSILLFEIKPIALATNNLLFFLLSLNVVPDPI